MMVDPTTRYCLALVAISGAVLWVYARQNEYNNIERFYYRTDRLQYGLLKAAYFVIFASFILSIRTLIVNAYNGAKASGR